MTVLFVEYPKCSTCKKAKKWLDEHGIDYIDRHIVEDNPRADELAAWQAKSGLPVRRFFNTSGMLYREQGVKARLDAGMSDEDAFALLAENGMMVKRPLVVGEDLCWWALKRRSGRRRCSKDVSLSLLRQTSSARADGESTRLKNAGGCCTVGAAPSGARVRPYRARW